MIKKTVALISAMLFLWSSVFSQAVMAASSLAATGSIAHKLLQSFLPSSAGRIS